MLLQLWLPEEAPYPCVLSKITRASASIVVDITTQMVLENLKDSNHKTDM